MTRFETLFTIRYAIRVLERGRRFSAKIDVLLKVRALLSVSSAIYAIGATDQRIDIVFGAFFALTDARHMTPQSIIDWLAQWVR